MPIVAKGGQERIRQQAGGQGLAPTPDYATGTVHHDAILDDGTVLHHHQRFESGVLTDWVRDDEPGPWALVRHGDPRVTLDIADGSALPGPEQAASVSIRLGDELIPMPPLDDGEGEEWSALPYVPDATAYLRFELTGSPVGPLAMDIRYVDGRRPMCRIVDDWSAPADGEAAHGAPEMHIAMTWRNYLRMRAGEVTALEGIEEGGNVDARWTLLLLLHGLLQQPTYIENYRSLPVIPEELRWWGEIAPWIGPPDWS